jgi:hypothetical protein
MRWRFRSPLGMYLHILGNFTWESCSPSGGQGQQVWMPLPMWERWGPHLQFIILVKCSSKSKPLIWTQVPIPETQVVKESKPFGISRFRDLLPMNIYFRVYGNWLRRYLHMSEIWMEMSSKCAVTHHVVIHAMKDACNFLCPHLLMFGCFNIDSNSTLSFNYYLVCYILRVLCNAIFYG